MRAIFLILFFTPCLTVWAQTVSYTVMKADGDVKFETAKKSILIGTKINEGDTLRLKQGLLILKCSTSDTLRLDQPGLYVINQRMCKIGKEKPDLLWVIAHKFEELFHPEDPHEWRKHLKILGGVHRAKRECSCEVDSNLQSIYYYGGEFDLTWNCNADQKPIALDVYKNTAKNTADFSTPVKVGHYPLKELVKHLKNGNVYYWVVKRSESCKEFSVLHYVSKEEYELMKKSISTVANQATKNKAEQQYLMGVLFESKHYYADAYLFYKEASKLSKKGSFYKGNLEDFRVIYGLK